MLLIFKATPSDRSQGSLACVFAYIFTQRHSNPVITATLAVEGSTCPLPETMTTIQPLAILIILCYLRPQEYEPSSPHHLISLSPSSSGFLIGIQR